MSRAELRDALIASLVIAAMATMVVSIFSLIGQESGRTIPLVHIQVNDEDPFE